MKSNQKWRQIQTIGSFSGLEPPFYFLRYPISWVALPMFKKPLLKRLLTLPPNSWGRASNFCIGKLIISRCVEIREFFCTVWKFQDFLSFRFYVKSGALNFVNLVNFKLQKGQKFTKIKIQSLWMCKNGRFCTSRIPKFDFT